MSANTMNQDLCTPESSAERLALDAVGVYALTGGFCAGVSGPVRVKGFHPDCGSVPRVLHF